MRPSFSEPLASAVGGNQPAGLSPRRLRKALRGRKDSWPSAKPGGANLQEAPYLRITAGGVSRHDGLKQGFWRFTAQRKLVGQVLASGVG